jgi:hypothetical protein
VAQIANDATQFTDDYTVDPARAIFSPRVRASEDTVDAAA